MSCWWLHHNPHFTYFYTADKHRIEDLTGCIPLLLKPFLMHSGKSLQSLEPLIWEDKLLASVRMDTIDFALKKRFGLEQTTYVCFPVRMF
jgi:hypothetical protein